MTRIEGIAKLLAEHEDLHRGPDYWYCGNPECDAYIADAATPLGLAREAHRGHVAAVVDEWLAGQEREEWGLRVKLSPTRTTVSPSPTEEVARLESAEAMRPDLIEVVHRRVTDWEGPA